jgi:hypothetical protein
MERVGSGLDRRRKTGRNGVLEGGSAGALTALSGPGMVVWWVPGGPGRWLFRLLPRRRAAPIPFPPLSIGWAYGAWRMGGRLGSL